MEEGSGVSNQPLSEQTIGLEFWYKHFSITFSSQLGSLVDFQCHLSELLCIEVSAGHAQLSSCLRAEGFGIFLLITKCTISIKQR